MNHPDFNQFSEQWEAAWNAHDLEKILSFFSEDIVFRSRKALHHVGFGDVQGKALLREYWSMALAEQPDLKFCVKHVLTGHQMMTLLYTNQHNALTSETLFFNDDGLIYQASACQENWQFPSPYRLQVDLWVVPGRLTAFNEFEQNAFANMAKYGGEVISIQRPNNGAHERHLIEFPSEKAFNAYRNGPESISLVDARNACVAKTEVLVVASFDE